MTLRKISKEQPEKFEFTQENLDEANRIIKKYPKGRQQSAVMSLLYLAQKQNDNWIPLSAMKHIGKILDMPYVKVYEVATFYTMYNLTPVGKSFVQVCTTTPCMIRGAYKLVEACKEKISENEKALKILDQIISGKKPEPGSYRGRLNSEPENNRKTLLDVKNA